MSDKSLFIQIACLLLIILGYLAYLFYSRQKILKTNKEGKKRAVPGFSGSLNTQLQKRSQENQNERAHIADKIIRQDNGQMMHVFVLPSDIEIIETDYCLLLRGPVTSLAAVCGQFSAMEQLPEGYCMQLADWKLFVLEDYPQSSREDKTITMPADHWLFMGSKLRDSIYGEDVHPYNYIYEPFTFKKVLDYGIGIEAVDYDKIKNEEI